MFDFITEILDTIVESFNNSMEAINNFYTMLNNRIIDIQDLTTSLEGGTVEGVPYLEILSGLRWLIGEPVWLAFHSLILLGLLGTVYMLVIKIKDEVFPKLSGNIRFPKL